MKPKQMYRNDLNKTKNWGQCCGTAGKATAWFSRNFIQAVMSHVPELALLTAWQGSSRWLHYFGPWHPTASHGRTSWL